MSKKNNSQKEELGLIGKIVVGSMLALLILCGIAFFMAFYFFGFAGLFMTLGVDYHSIKTLVIFIIWYFVIGIFFELIFKGIFYTVAGYLKRYRSFVYILFDSMAGWLAIFTVDEILAAITIASPKELLIAVIFALAEYAFEDKKGGKK